MAGLSKSMSLFQYKARGKRGDAIEGLMDAASSDVVAAQLLQSGLIPIDIVPAVNKLSSTITWDALFPIKVTATDIIQFSRQMHSLMKTGVPILSALAGLAESTKNKTLKDAIRDISLSLQSGRDLATALSDHSKIFSLFYVSMIRIGETSGKLGAIFLQLSRYLERDEKTKKQIRSALRYPVFVMLAIGFAIFVINVFVIPEFSKMFSRYDATLPIATKILVGTSSFFIHYWVLLLAGMVVGAMWFKYSLKTTAGLYRWDKLKLRFPLIGSVVYRATLARFARLFAMSTQAGVPLITAITVVAKALDNAYVEQNILDMRTGIERGESISRTALATGMFDSLVLQMLSVGEETGAVDELLQEVADYYDMEVEYDIGRLSASIEPILTIVIGVIVLVLALGVFLPMWSVANVALH
ncbi:MAG: type II secretion system F family protein [Gammaproteobacteria bacterium]|nr:type II secretion system F family protein [Gammaproteobacteria bacterium]